MEHPRTVPADRIAAVLWGAARPASPAQNIATFVSRLRRVLGPGVIEGGRPGYRLGSPPAVLIDLDDASRWVAEAERRLAAAEPALAVATATRASDLLTAGLVAGRRAGRRVGRAGPRRARRADPAGPAGARRGRAGGRRARPPRLPPRPRR